ncbi:MAG: hypothetical protein J6Y60_08970 [Treponema sp.]|nr:hypothetical protein [Treponema sp.]
MKKFIAVFAALVVMSSAVFAQNESSDSNSWMDNFRVEADVGLGLGSIRIETRAAYRFPINDILAWDAGLDLAFIMPSFLGNFTEEPSKALMVTPFASFWFWDFYVCYGLGLGVNFSNGFLIGPVDFRIGWQPNFRKRDKGFLFKMELGLIPSWLPASGGVAATITPSITLGTTYKF